MICPILTFNVNLMYDLKLKVKLARTEQKSEFTLKIIEKH